MAHFRQRCGGGCGALRKQRRSRVPAAPGGEGWGGAGLRIRILTLLLTPVEGKGGGLGYRVSSLALRLLRSPRVSVYALVPRPLEAVGAEGYGGAGGRDRCLVHLSGEGIGAGGHG